MVRLEAEAMDEDILRIAISIPLWYD